MTEELFRKAQEKVREDKIRAKSGKNDLKAKKLQIQQEQEMIKYRNRELVERQKERGVGPSLKEKEERLK